MRRKFPIACGSPGYVERRTVWRPTAETGGTGSNEDIARPDWTRCVNVAEGRWSRDSSSGYAYSYGAAVKFKSAIGIDLGISREYSSRQKLEYNVDGDNKRLCGNNTWPASAGKIMMRWQG